MLCSHFWALYSVPLIYVVRVWPVMSDSFATSWTVATRIYSVTSILRISQARILEWVAISAPGDLSHPGIKPMSPALAGRFLTAEPPRSVFMLGLYIIFLFFFCNSFAAMF